MFPEQVLDLVHWYAFMPSFYVYMRQCCFSLLNYHFQARAIYTDAFKGVMTPPVLADVTGDGVEDIIVAVFNSSVLAFDGWTYKVIWNYTVPLTESYRLLVINIFISKFIVRQSYSNH